MEHYKLVKLSFTTPTDSIVGEIYEYDIVAAFFNFIVYYCNDIVTENKIDHLRSLSVNKKKRNIFIGLLQRSYKKVLKERLTDLNKYFIDSFITLNGIAPHQIVSIKKDAIFVTKKCEKLKIEKIEFSLKNEYNYFYQFRSLQGTKLELYAGGDRFSLKGAQKQQEQNQKMFSILGKVFIKFFEMSFEEFTIFSKTLVEQFEKNSVSLLDDESTVILNFGLSAKYKNIKNTKYVNEINLHWFKDQYLIPLINSLIRSRS